MRIDWSAHWNLTMNHLPEEYSTSLDHGAAAPTKREDQAPDGRVGFHHKGRSQRVQPDSTASLLIKYKGVVASQLQEPRCLALIPSPIAHQLFVLSLSCLIIKQG